MILFIILKKSEKPFKTSYIRHHGGFALPSCKRVHLLVFGILSFSLREKADSRIQLLQRSESVSEKVIFHTYHKSFLRFNNVPASVPLIDVAA